MEYIDSIIKEGRRRGLSNRTIKTYCYCVNNFFKKYHKEPKQVTKKDIREFLDNFIEKERAGNTINVYLNSLKFFFEEILGKRMRLNIKYSKTPKTLPIVLTKEEVKKLINSIENKKHRLMIELLYSSGLRVSELVNLKAEDLEIEKGYGYIRKGKGKKDRLFVIADCLKEKLMDEIKDNSSWLFKSNKNYHISQRTIQEIIKKASKKVGIKKKVHPHTLRHSFATHLIENGYSVSSVQSLLGHSNINTTMIYVHMASPKLLNIKSPLDEL